MPSETKRAAQKNPLLKSIPEKDMKSSEASSPRPEKKAIVVS
jgi:hypothetical protein